jgi:hypothetical protein
VGGHTLPGPRPGTGGEGGDDLSTAALGTPLPELDRVATAAQRIEACIERSKSEAGLADDEVRNRAGWQQHQTLLLLATWLH